MPTAPGGFQLGPPEGQRFARGEFSPFSDEAGERVEAPQPELTSIEVPSPAEVLVEDEEPLEPLDSYPEADVPPPPPSNNNGHYSPFSNPDTPRDKEQGLFEHLAELRLRLLWSFAAVGFGMAVAWHFGPPLQAWFARPIVSILTEAGVPGAGENKLVFNDPTGALSAYFYFSMVAGIIFSAPFLIFQIWRFVEPALTNNERRYSGILIPFSTVLFAMGVALGYWCSPLFFKFFLIWLPQGTVAYWDYYSSIILMAKMLLVFGVCFQVPIIIIFLNKLGIVSRNILIEYWRHAVVFIFVIVAVLTPTWDPLTMTICAGPPCILYALSIWLVKWL